MHRRRFIALGGAALAAPALLRHAHAQGYPTAQRQPEVPHLPSIGEFVPGYHVSSWFALFVAAKTPGES